MNQTSHVESYIDHLKLKLKVKSWLRKIQYKPNFKFYIEDEDSFFVLKIIFMTTDSTDFSNQIKIGMSHTLDYRDADHMNFERFYKWVRHQILEAETHEMNEFFRVDGKVVFDPHKGKI